MSDRTWHDISPEEREAAVRRRVAGESADSVLASLGISPSAWQTIYRNINHGVYWWRVFNGDAEAPSHSDDDATLLAILRRAREIGLYDLADAANTSPRLVREAVQRLQEGGYVIVQDAETLSAPSVPPPVTTKLPPMWREKAGIVRWAAISDLHAGSKAAQKSALKHFMQRAWERYGVDHTLISGDLVAGIRVYKGQEFDVYASGVDEQVDDLTNNYLPYRKGHRYYAIGGNHDHAFFKVASVDVLRLIAQARDDFEHCGWDEADVRLTEKADIRMWHPSGGVPYALSYRGQKYAAQVGQQELLDVVLKQKAAPRVRIVQIGHLHVVGGPFMQGPMHVFQSGCFEGRTSYLKRKGLVPAVAGYIFEAEITETGLIRELTFRCLPYSPIEDDYKGHGVEPKAAEETTRVMYRFEDLEAQ